MSGVNPNARVRCLCFLCLDMCPGEGRKLAESTAKQHFRTHGAPQRPSFVPWHATDQQQAVEQQSLCHEQQGEGDHGQRGAGDPPGEAAEACAGSKAAAHADLLSLGTWGRMDTPAEDSSCSLGDGGGQGRNAACSWGTANEGLAHLQQGDREEEDWGREQEQEWDAGDTGEEEVSEDEGEVGEGEELGEEDAAADAHAGPPHLAFAAGEGQQAAGGAMMLWEGQPGMGDGGRLKPRCQKAAYAFTPGNGCSAAQLRRHLLGRLSNRAQTHQTQKSVDLDLQLDAQCEGMLPLWRLNLPRSFKAMVAALQEFGVRVRGTVDYDVCRCGFTYRCGLHLLSCTCLGCMALTCAGMGSWREGGLGQQVVNLRGAVLPAARPAWRADWLVW